MSQDRASLELIEEKLTLILEQQKETCQSVQSFNRRMMGFEQKFGLIHRFTQETLTYVKRIQPYIEKAMKTLHEAFRLVANGIWNLRDEQSEFAGNIINSELDIKIV